MKVRRLLPRSSSGVGSLKFNFTFFWEEKGELLLRFILFFKKNKKNKKKVNLLEFLVRFNSRPPGGSAYSVKCRLKLTFEKNSLTITCVTRRANDVRLKKKHVKQSVCVCVCRIFRRQSKTGDETYDQEAAGPRVAPPTA